MLTSFDLYRSKNRLNSEIASKPALSQRRVVFLSPGVCFCRLPSLSHPSLICAESNLSALQPHPYLPPLCTWGLSAHGGCCYSSFPQLEHSRVPRLHRLSGRGPRRLIPHPPPQVFVHLRPPQSPRPPCTSPQASGSQNQKYSDGNSSSRARNEPSRIEMFCFEV